MAHPHPMNGEIRDSSIERNGPRPTTFAQSPTGRSARILWRSVNGSAASEAAVNDGRVD